MDTLLRTVSGWLYGVTYWGGASSSTNQGVWFKMDPEDTTKFEKLFDFEYLLGQASGTLLETSDGELYAANLTSRIYDGFICNYDPYNTIAGIKPLITFKGINLDTVPISCLMQASDQRIYGIASQRFISRSFPGFVYSFDLNNISAGITRLGTLSGVNPVLEHFDGRLIEPCDFIKIVEQPSSQHICNSAPITLQVSSIGANLSFQWLKDKIPIAEGNANVFHLNKPTISDTGFYKCVVSNGCRKVVSAPAKIIFSTLEASPDTTICSGQPLTLSSHGALTYTWTGGILDKVPFNPTNTSTYIVKGNTAPNCIQSDSVKVTVNSLPGISAGTEISVCEGQSVSLTGTGAVTYSWTGGVLNGVPFVPQASMVYTVTGTSANGCTNTSFVLVSITGKCPQDSALYIEILNVFTPNNDNLNETFSIHTNIKGPWSIQIYNRWGTKVYSEGDYKNDWSAPQCTNGIYYYYLSNDQYPNSYHGWIEVVR